MAVPGTLTAAFGARPFDFPLVVPTIILVIAMDSLSGWLRRGLIHGKDG